MDAFVDPIDGFIPWPEQFAERYRERGYWSGETLGALTRQWAAREPDRTCLVYEGQRFSYAELDRRADRAAAGLHALGLRRGDRVLMQLPNVPALVYLSLAMFRLGVLPVYALAPHRHAELNYLADLTGAKAYVIPDRLAGFDYRPLAKRVLADNPAMRWVIVDGDAGDFTPLSQVDGEPIATTGPHLEDVAFFLLSGGTTGLPKLIPRTHADYGYQLRACARELGLDETAVYLAALPAAHNAALGCPGVLGTLGLGGKVVLCPTPSPDDAFPLLRDEGVTITTLMPPLLAVWAELAGPMEADLNGLIVEVGGANLQPPVAYQMMKLGCRLTHWFGMAEGVLSFTRLDAPPDIVAHTQGRALCPDDEYRVVDDEGRDVAAGEVGELLARGPCTLRGYYRADDYNRSAFTADGYLRTGDVVRFTDAGDLMVTGRIKDIINRGGEKIGAAELEGYLEAHPRVRSCAVIAVADAALGEKTCAFVVPQGDRVELGELRAFLTEHGLAAYKLPDRLEFVDALPRTNVGKIDKNQLRVLAAERAQGSRR